MDRVNAVGITPRHSSRQHSYPKKANNVRDEKADNDSENSTQQQNFDYIPEASELQSLVEKLNALGNNQHPHLLFKIDKSTSIPTVNMSDHETDELLRIIPADEFLYIANQLLNEGTSLNEHPGQWIDLDV